MDRKSFYEDAANLLIQKEYGAAVKESGEDVVSAGD